MRRCCMLSLHYYYVNTVCVVVLLGKNILQTFRMTTYCVCTTAVSQTDSQSNNVRSKPGRSFVLFVRDLTKEHASLATQEKIQEIKLAFRAQIQQAQSAAPRHVV